MSSARHVAPVSNNPSDFDHQAITPGSLDHQTPGRKANKAVYS